MYKVFIRPLLFCFEPERIHHFAFSVMRIFFAVPGSKHLINALYAKSQAASAKKILGLHFKNPVGLAAGFDKDARLIDELACFGFGFIEIGTLTPLPQPGNEKPRLFRLPSDSALINRMGFNNQGVANAAQRLKKRKSDVIVGGNIGKNKATANELAYQDYEICFETLYPYVDYFVINVSSPNTPGLRDLQEKEPLSNLLRHVKQLNEKKPKPKPVLLKIAPDLTSSQLDDIVEILQITGTDGVIATNTTISRERLKTPADALHSIGNGGLSGAPLRERATEVIKYLRSKLGPRFPIIGVGGIMSPRDAAEKLQAGADLIQLYTGFVYEGPGIVKRINKHLLQNKVGE